MKSELPMTPSRRDWIRSAGALVVTVATPGWLMASAVTVRRPVGTLDLLDMPLAQSMIGHQFELASAEGHAICELTRVSALGRASGKTQKAFSVDFRPITRHGNLQQDTYSVHHPVLGTFDLFLVPHTNDRGELTLLATFSRL